ncbi:undecaprenyldiphospho-muramoylpentapeptide beta-N-acetylglucosaminyltransferase [Aquabacterium fontiphilum]|jgi:UDP-N-acetylglucosamine--N-acetylmuramyl-(pentapeptide) pyrophosphoryl-undecaprenol N-acetylglucosamine transferase|uniref:undecaprenyldiphospho-muramoylpentapeptide beta-N-acetylglucosaminyltransferase n=1 Tax=Aquabacterium fontiphilum TaxID=450365 RepID=UPI0013787D3E|nr:undecaprenyldiphospho-muramoylpentapeptide beta-N-acetylglucosaminyltransferase [Aquabacterium fontiphilum]NBD20851.1 undecaprenyldiphospho-muramoylpentapeptide beta-N-acetylglucosaminyltransferase [Aquabacterium fontiphilum]
MSRHLVIMAAGTGGHIMPGLAVADEMKRRGWTVSWLGTATGMENRLVPPTGIPMDTIAFNGLRGKGLKDTVFGGVRLLKAFADCYGILKRRQANAVLGMGGYVCFPGGVMSAARGLPLVMVNADAAMLLSNRALLPITDVLACGFDGPAAQHKVARVTGNPVRAEIEAIAQPDARFAGREGPLRIMVVGGSLGARALNELIPQALARIPTDQRPRITHQTGMANLESVKADYAKAGLNASSDVELLPFINNMAQRLADCDVILCRAGAITVSELCAAGVASLLVPLVVSTTAHQRDNAQYMAQHGAALHLPQSELSAERLAATLQGLSRPQLLAMAQKARALARPQSAAAVADALEQLVNRNLKKAST